MKHIIYNMEPLWNEWKVKEKLGEGSYGEVFRIVKNEKEGKIREAAVKIIAVPPSEQAFKNARSEGLNEENAKIYFKEMLENTLNEAKLMIKMSDCPNIVKFEDYQVLENKQKFGWMLLIRMEKLMNLNKMIIDNNMNIYDVAKLGIDICNALEYCRKKGIVHKDIKPDNIFYSQETNTYKLGDFGISHYIKEPTEGKGRAGTLSHMSPEVYKGMEFTPDADLYALGVILYKLLNNNRIPFLPYYPKEYTVKQRNQALVRRLKGESIIPPSSCYITEKNNNNTERIGIKIEKKILNLQIN